MWRTENHVGLEKKKWKGKNNVASESKAITEWEECKIKIWSKENGKQSKTKCKSSEHRTFKMKKCEGKKKEANKNIFQELSGS